MEHSGWSEDDYDRAVSELFKQQQQCEFIWDSVLETLKEVIQVGFFLLLQKYYRVDVC